MKTKFNNKLLKKKLSSSIFLTILFFVITIVLLKFAERNSAIVEYYYSEHIYSYLTIGLTFFSGSIPFSLSDIFYFVIIVVGLILFLRSFFRRKYFKTFLKYVFYTFFWFAIIFTWFFGFNRFRVPLSDRLKVADKQIDSMQFKYVANWLVKDVNNLNSLYVEYSDNDFQKHVINSYILNSAYLRVKKHIRLSKVKPITLSKLFAGAGIAGYYGPFFSEVHLNSKLTKLEYPFDLAHEMAHKFGIVLESEANFYAWYVCYFSKDNSLKYIAQLNLLRYFLSQSNYFYSLIKDLGIKDEVLTDLHRIQLNWKKYRNEKHIQISRSLNNSYLKAVKIEDGIRNYNGVVKYVMNYAISHRLIDHQSGTNNNTK
ncbi:MAG: DUF3810 family protein [Bacteroidales bacterium]